MGTDSNGYKHILEPITIHLYSSYFVNDFPANFY